MKKHSLSIILFFLCLVLSDVFSQTKVDWRQIKNTPTSIEGYGITNAISTSVLDNALATFTEEVVRIDSEIATITNELERVENLIPNNASFTFQGLSEIEGTVGSENLANYSVTTVKLATDSVTTSRIADLNVTTDKIADYAITSAKMGAESVNRYALASGAVEADKLADDSVSNRALQDNSVSYETLDISLQQTIDTANAGILDNSIVGSKLATQTVTHDYLGYGSVLNDNIGQGEVDSNSIEDYSVDFIDLATASVDTRILQDLSVTNDKIANLAVTNSKIDFGAISFDRMSANSVGSAHIVDKNVTEIKLANNAVVERVIASNSVTVDKIKDGEITPSKLNTLVSWSFDVLAVSTLNGGIINLANLTELPPSLAGALAFMNDDLYIKKSGYWDKLLAESDVAIPNNASFTLSGLGEKDFASLTNKPTTLSGYGITDAAPTYHSTIETTYGLGTTSEYGHVRTINDLNHGLHAQGLALSAYQGYVLNNAVGAKLDKAGGMINGDLTVLGNITGTVSTATTALNALAADYATEAGSSVSSNNSDFATYAETAHTIVASSTQSTDTLPIAFESPAYPNSPSSYSGFYSPTDSTIVMRTGTDSYKFEYNQVTLGEDVTFIGRSADADEPELPNPLYISGSNTALTGGNIALGGYNNPSLSLRLRNKSLLYLWDNIYPVMIASHTHIQGRLNVSDYVSTDALLGNWARADRLHLSPIERSELPAGLPSFGIMYFDVIDKRFYGRNNNVWEILNSKNSDFTLAGLSEKSYNSLTDKPTIPTNSSFTLAGLSEKNFSSLDNKPTTLSGYGITDGVNTSDSRLTDARTPLAHAHGSITNDGKIGSTSGLVVTTTTGGVLTTSNRSGIDSRSTFPPASHTHEYVSKTGDTMTGALTIGTDTSTSGSTMVQSRYPNGAPNLLGTMRSSGGTMLGYGLRPSNTVANGFESSVGVALSRSAMILDGGGIKFFTAPSSTTAIGTAITPSEVFSISNNGAVSIPQTLSVTNGITGNLTGTASKATADASGNTITATYATKSDNPRKFLVTPLRNKTYRIGSITGHYNGITLYCGNAANYDNYSEITWLIESQTGIITEVFNACAPLNPAYKKRLHTYKDASNKVWIYLVCPNYNDSASLYLDNNTTSPSFNISILDVTDTWATEIADKTLLDSNPTSIGGKGITSNGFFGNLTGNVTGNVTGNLTGNADTANVANALDNTVDVGNTTTPVYFKDGLPMTISYTIAKSVPSNAVFTDTTYSNMVGATTSATGTAGLVPAPSAGATTRYLRSDGTWQIPPDTNTTMVGATTSATGTAGLVPAPSAGAATRYLRSDGTWQIPVSLDFLKTLIDSFSCAEFASCPALISAPALRLVTMPSELTTPHIFEWINASYSVGIATYTDGPAHGQDNYAFYGSTLLPNGKVMLTPRSSANIGIYDPIKNTYTNGPAHGKSWDAFIGSTLLPNGKVMLTPFRSANIGIYDPVENTYTNGPTHGKGNNAFAGSTMMPNGKVMLVPHLSANIGIYDPDTDTYTNGPLHGKGSYAFFGSTLMPNGKVMLTPRNSTHIGIYDPIENTYTDGPPHEKGSNAFYGSTLMPNGKVMLTPCNSPTIGIYDPIANTYTDGPEHGQGSDAFQGSTLMPNGKVMLTPYKSANIGIYDPDDDTYTDGPLHGKGDYAFNGCTMMPNGKVMLVPSVSANIGIYNPAIIDLKLRDWPLLSAYFNKF